MVDASPFRTLLGACGGRRRRGCKKRRKNTIEKQEDAAAIVASLSPLNSRDVTTDTPVSLLVLVRR